jgi:hypothetical protein
MANFRFTAAFETQLEELAKKLNKTKTATLVEATLAYKSGVLPDKAVIDLLNQLKADNADFKAALDNNHTLLLAILKELQNR